MLPRDGCSLTSGSTVVLSLYALLFLPALLAIALVVLRRPKTLAEAVPENPFAELDAVLAELESATLEERSADELVALAERLERIA